MDANNINLGFHKKLGTNFNHFLTETKEKAKQVLLSGSSGNFFLHFSCA